MLAVNVRIPPLRFATSTAVFAAGKAIATGRRHILSEGVSDDASFMDSVWWVFCFALWFVAALAGLLTAPEQAELCRHGHCAVHQAGYVVLVRSLDALRYFGEALTGIATILLVGVTWLLARATSSIWKHTRKIERAYVKMSHTAPGLTVLPMGARVTTQIKNSGHTPAQIIGAVLKLDILPNAHALPDPPDYHGAITLEDSSAFLAAGGKYYVNTAFVLPAHQVARIGNPFLSTYL